MLFPNTINDILKNETITDTKHTLNLPNLSIYNPINTDNINAPVFFNIRLNDNISSVIWIWGSFNNKGNYKDKQISNAFAYNKHNAENTITNI